MTAAYLDYLESKEWWDVRKRMLQRAGYRCERCGCCGSSNNALDVHHQTYVNLGNEPDDDLEVLCRTCHRNDHALRNWRLREREQFGQARLFDRWDDPDPPTIAKKHAA